MESLARAEQLLTSSEEADAAYLSGYIRGHRLTAAEQVLSRARFEQALRGYQRSGRHAEASRAAGFLSRLPRPELQFDDSLQMAQLAITEAQQIEDPQVLGRANAALAEAYAAIGMEHAARESFLRAETLLAPWPAELAQVYLKHANFLLDLASERDLTAALHLFDATDQASRKAEAAGQGALIAELPFAALLNRTDTLSQLGQLDAARRELAAAARLLTPASSSAQVARFQLVAGYVAARLGDLPEAEARFAQADDGALEGDYRWRIAVELARAHAAVGQMEEAERYLRGAIAIVESLRGSSTQLELRPWVLARRNVPYHELLALLATQRRGVEALAVAESLHARAWLDAVIGAEEERSSPEHALTAARLRSRLDVASTPALDGPALLSALGEREALVYVVIGAVVWRAHILRGDVELTRLPPDTQEAAEAFRAAPEDARARARASQRLLPPDLSTSGQPLHVIATGPLADLPFAALQLQNAFLISTRPIARLPGLAALRCAASSWETRAVLLGDSHGDLPAAAGEVRQLAATLATPAHIGPGATRRVLATARRASLLHIAAHGIATPAGRAIVLADGNLLAADVLEQDLAPQVVVLSGCATATSEAPEAWDGFPSAFLAAGTRYVVATLRTVRDADAAALIAAYYAQPATQTPIERLAAAQAQLATTLPVKAWSSFSAWGSTACSEPQQGAATPVAPAMPAAAPAAAATPGPRTSLTPPPVRFAPRRASTRK